MSICQDITKLKVSSPQLLGNECDGFISVQKGEKRGKMAKKTKNIIKPSKINILTDLKSLNYVFLKVQENKVPLEF